MKNLITLTFILFTLVFNACSVEPQPIQYGVDQCANCKMTIVDQSHGAQLVTKKGRVASFDAIECMTDYLKDKDEADFAHILAADLSNPGELVDATSATFLISKQIPSPMGAFLSGFSNKSSADSILSTVDGRLLTWKELRDEK